MEGQPEAITPTFPVLPTEMLFQIFGQLDDQSLFSCRLVSKGCCEVSSTILQSRPKVIVGLWCHLTSESKGSLAAFTKCFKQSRKYRHIFPYVNYHLKGFQGTVSKCPDVETFFTLSKQSNSESDPGLLIKFLKFEVQINKTKMSDLERLIFKRTPQLSKLSLNIFRNAIAQSTGVEEAPKHRGKSNESVSTAEKTTLLSLRVLQVHGCTGVAAVDFVTQILRMGPNIERIETGDEGNYHLLHPDNLQPLIDTEKLHLIKKCSIGFHKELVVSGLLMRGKLPGFQPASLELETFHSRTRRRQDWDDNREQTKSSLRDLLWTVKDTVEELQVDDSFGLLTLQDFPVFSKLRQLHWWLYQVHFPILPVGIRNGDDFPKLEEIDIIFLYSIYDDRLLPQHLPVAPSVHRLVIRLHGFSKFTKSFLQFMSLMCPNLRSFELHCPTIHDSWVNSLIWTNMKQLKILKLYKPHVCDKSAMDELEAWFTGFSLATVRRITATKPQQRPKVEDVEHLRESHSILELTELNMLIIDLNPMGKKKKVEDLPLSYKYAFNLMPELTVNLCST